MKKKYHIVAEIKKKKHNPNANKTKQIVRLMKCKRFMRKIANTHQLDYNGGDFKNKKYHKYIQSEPMLTVAWLNTTNDVHT